MATPTPSPTTQTDPTTEAVQQYIQAVQANAQTGYQTEPSQILALTYQQMAAQAKANGDPVPTLNSLVIALQNAGQTVVPTDIQTASAMLSAAPSPTGSAPAGAPAAGAASTVGSALETGVFDTGLAGKPPATGRAAAPVDQFAVPGITSKPELTPVQLASLKATPLTTYTDGLAMGTAPAWGLIPPEIQKEIQKGIVEFAKTHKGAFPGYTGSWTSAKALVSFVNAQNPSQVAFKTQAQQTKYGVETYLEYASQVKGLKITPEIQKLAEQAAKTQMPQAAFLYEVHQTDSFKQAQKSTTAGLVDNYLSTAGSLGIPITPEIQKMAEQAAKQGISTTAFGYQVKQTDTYMHHASQQYFDLLHGYGVTGTDKATRELIQKGVGLGWNADEFMAHYRDTPDYHKFFPGNLTPFGHHLMTEAEYANAANSFRSMGRNYGEHISDTAIGHLIKNGVSADELKQRLDQVSSVDTHSPYFAQLQTAMGKPMDFKEMLKFVRGESAPEWYQTWRSFENRSAAFQGGITDEKLIAQGSKLQGSASEGQMASSYAALAQQIQHVLPLSRIQKYGLSKTDLATLQFGGPGSAQIGERVKRVLATEQAAGEKRAGLAAPDNRTISQNQAQTL